MNKSFKDFMADNEIELLELAFDRNSTLIDVASEKYQIYLESIRDRDHD
jgi:hypothetical protein